ncbi:MAG TPA: hypothetical protein VFD71_09085 [Planctomycetota bacterium]|jgi:hypothetical protein|nr:hypothetical protein [Planctomycetota bacterium]
MTPILPWIVVALTQSPLLPTTNDTASAASEFPAPTLELAHVYAAAQGAAPESDAASSSFGDVSRAGRVSVRAGIGFTVSPDTFLLALEADCFIIQNLSIGPLVQVGLSGDPIIVAPTLNFQWMFDLGPGADQFKPYAQWGLGAAYIHKDRNNRDDDDFGFLANLGFGFDFCINDNFAVGTNILFNILPGEVLNETFFFSWQVATVTFRF